MPGILLSMKDQMPKDIYNLLIFAILGCGNKRQAQPVAWAAENLVRPPLFICAVQRVPPARSPR